MNVLNLCRLSLVVLFGMTLSARGEEAPPETPADAKGFVYKTVNGIDVKLDVFAPPAESAAKPRPVLVYFHGGGWDSGDKGYTYRMCRYFAKRGLVVVTANYRFKVKDAPGLAGTKTICLVDAKSAVRWVRAHAKEIGADPNRVILGGSSAGSYLAMMAALEAAPDDPADNTKIPTTASALLLLSPALATPPPEGTKADPVDPAAWWKTPLPPMFAIFGENDHLRSMSVPFLLACQAKGTKVEMWAGPGQEHAFKPPDLWMDAICIKADDFLSKLGFTHDAPGDLPAGTSFLKVSK